WSPETYASWPPAQGAASTDRPCEPYRSLAGEAFLVVGLLGGQFVLRGFGGVVRFDAAGEARALHALGAQVVERLDALLPRLEVQHHQVPLVDSGREEQVEALRLVDVRRAVGGEFGQPALVDLEAGLVDRLLLGREEVEVLDRAAALEDRVPDVGRILALRSEQLLEVRVLDHKRARQRLVRVDVGRDRLDARRRAAADDADRRGRRDRHLAAETLHHALLGRVGAGAALFREDHRGLVGLLVDVLE